MKPTRRAYTWPFVEVTTTPTFLDAISVESARLREHLSARGIAYRLDSTWLRLELARPKETFWLPKLYLCIGKDYWKVAERVVCDDALRKSVAGIKVLFPLRADGRLPHRATLAKHFARPDKMVVYLNDIASARAVIRRLAVLRGSAGTHALSHAGRVDHYGFADRATARGIYLGLDPSFLSESWRAYSALALAWLHLNRGAVRDAFGSVEAWLTSMNLSQRHEGPVQFKHTKPEVAFIQQQWRLISPSRAPV